MLSHGPRNGSLAIGIFLVLGIANPVLPFQTEAPAGSTKAEARDALLLLEAGRAKEGVVPSAIVHLGEGEYAQSLAAVTPEVEAHWPWLSLYLEDLVRVSAPLVHVPSKHFDFYLPPSQVFLADYAAPVLESAADYFEKELGHRPASRIRVEIYPDQESFSRASTLSIETLERSGAIGICKFHRLMILTPQALPTGYRWLDALAHEYLHLMINEITDSKAELWLHEGTARYFETAHRVQPPHFLTPHQKTELKKALKEGELVPFERMSPSMVYLKDQDQVSLAFAQVSHAVEKMISNFGRSKFIGFMASLRQRPFPEAFKKAYGLTPLEFEERWKGCLAKEPWEMTKGTVSDEVRFKSVSEDEVIGAEAMAKVRLGDRMRQKEWWEPALIQYEAALKEEPDNAFILLKAARTDLMLNKPERAIGRLRRATEKNPNYGTPHLELALLVEGNESLAHLIEANAINPFDPRIHARMGEIYRAMGLVDLARREDEISRSLKP